MPPTTKTLLPLSAACCLRNVKVMLLITNSTASWSELQEAHMAAVHQAGSADDSRAVLAVQGFAIRVLPEQSLHTAAHQVRFHLKSFSKPSSNSISCPAAPLQANRSRLTLLSSIEAPWRYLLKTGSIGDPVALSAAQLLQKMPSEQFEKIMQHYADIRNGLAQPSEVPIQAYIVLLLPGSYSRIFLQSNGHAQQSNQQLWLNIFFSSLVSSNHRLGEQQTMLHFGSLPYCAKRASTKHHGTRG